MHLSVYSCIWRRVTPTVFVPFNRWNIKLQSTQVALYLRAPYNFNSTCSGGGLSRFFRRVGKRLHWLNVSAQVPLPCTSSVPDKPHEVSGDVKLGKAATTTKADAVWRATGRYDVPQGGMTYYRAVWRATGRYDVPQGGMTCHMRRYDVPQGGMTCYKAVWHATGGGMTRHRRLYDVLHEAVWRCHRASIYVPQGGMTRHRRLYDVLQGGMTCHRAVWRAIGSCMTCHRAVWRAIGSCMTCHRAVWRATGRYDVPQGGMTCHRAVWHATEGGMTYHRAVWCATGRYDVPQGGMTCHRAVWRATGRYDGMTWHRQMKCTEPRTAYDVWQVSGKHWATLGRHKYDVLLAHGRH